MFEFARRPDRARATAGRAAARSRQSVRKGVPVWGRWSVVAVVAAVASIAGAGPRAAAAQAPAAGAPSAAARDSFAHARHTRLACMTCHLSQSGAMLTFEPPRGCQICHHVDEAKRGCAQCHEPGSVPAAIDTDFTIAAADKPARARTVAFRHEVHATQECAACHGQPVTLAPADSALTCRGCHAEHHEAGRNCATCHRTESITPPHLRPVQAHVACDQCHTTAAIAPLTPTRSFCLVCHDPSVDHHPERECAACHLQASPEAYRPHLLR